MKLWMLFRRKWWRVIEFFWQELLILFFYQALEIGHMGENDREEKLYHALKA